MLKRISAPIVLLVAIAASQIHAQVQDGPTPEQQQIMQQMQDLRMKILDNMQKQGVDPMQFFQQMMSQMQDGTFDINELNQQLIDKGLIDEESLTKVQDSIQKLTLDGIKRDLAVTDDEWAILVPKIKALVLAQAKVGAGTMGGMAGPPGINAFMAGQHGNNEVVTALRELRAAVRDKTSTDAILTEKLKAVRDARAKVQADVTAAKKELTDIITMRQEAILVHTGLIQ